MVRHSFDIMYVLTCQVDEISRLLYGIRGLLLAVFEYSSELGICRVAVESLDYCVDSHSRDHLSVCLLPHSQKVEGEGGISISLFEKYCTADFAWALRWCIVIVDRHQYQDR